jgi:hypothetical protein
MVGYRNDQTLSALNLPIGTLPPIAFAPTPAFAGMEFEPRLQLADLVVGATREFINFSLGKAKMESFGVQRFKALLPYLYKRNGKTLGGA